MGEILSILANICGILGFFISIFAVSKVITLTKSIGDKNSQFALGKNKQKISTGDKK